MQKFFTLFILTFIFFAKATIAQNVLPNITVKNINNQIVVSWINNYTKNITAINIQRSYDSLKNYTTIGSVLNAQSTENGYADSKPPYTKMYYRVFISFEGGSYIFSKITRPVKELSTPVEDSLHPFLVQDNWLVPAKIIYPSAMPPISTNANAYPSQRIFTAKDNNLIINLPDAETKKYGIKFFDENDLPVFELNKILDNFLIIEKVNFVHAGWFYFEIYESNKLIEKNKFYIAKDGKPLPTK